MRVFIDLDPALSGTPKLNENASLHRPLIGRREQRRDARLVVQRESRRAAIPRHFGENRSSAKRQPVAGNFHARTEAARPRLFTSCPCCAKHSVWKAEESGRPSGKIT